MEIKIICCNNNLRLRQTELAVTILNGVQNYFHYVLIKSENDVCMTDELDWDLFCNNIDDSEEFRIFITEKPFNDKWFSHESYKFSVVSTNDWETKFAPPSLKAYIAYQIAQSSISFAADLTEEMQMRMVHDRAEGCMFDFCYYKHDIKLGMIAGNICPQCQGILNRYGIQQNAVNAIERILHYIRSEAIGKTIIQNENQAFIVMRFSENDENDHAFRYGIQTALRKLNIHCVRADDQIVSAQILQNVKNGIERSRFVIVKVDSNNLNVYFELGLAMGLNKDVLLISDNEQVLNLPTDLKNWTCLTYQKGNYEELENSIMQFFRQNYYYE